VTVGGGLELQSDDLNMRDSIVAENVRGSGTPNDVDGSGSDDPYPGAYGVLIGADLVGTGLVGTGLSGFGEGGGNLLGTASNPIDPMLAPLGDYGGPTQTMALLDGSPAIGAGVYNTFASAAIDQRGVVRPQVSSDMGAFESQGFSITATTGSGQTAGTGQPFAAPLVATVTANDPNVPVAGIVVTFTPPSSGGGGAVLSGDTATTAADGTASVTATANEIVGGYAVTASATGVTGMASFALTNKAPSLVVDTTSDVGSHPDGLTSLRDAIAYADTLTNATITFDPTLFANGPQTITLTQGQLELSGSGLSATITGPAAGLTIDGGGLSRVFLVDPGVTASLSGLTIGGGSAAYGAGLEVEGSTLSEAGGTVTLTDCTITGNRATTSGGGMQVEVGASATLTDSTLAGNSSAYGGAINDNGTLTLTDCTIAANTASVQAGGLRDYGSATATLTDTIVADNTGGDLNNVNSGPASGTYNLIGTGGSGGLTSDRDNGNIILTTGTEFSPTNPAGLASLANYGGPTQTIPLLPGSPALGKGIASIPGVTVPTTDQRGEPMASPPDIGAFQTQAGSLVVNAISTGVSAAVNASVASITVTLNEPAGPGFFTTGALTLTDNGGPNLITDAVSITLVSGSTSTYSIGGLSTLTTAEGSYTLTVNAADIFDPDFNTGTGSLSTSWLMDTTPPTSYVNALAARGTSLSFPVTVTGSDPTAADGGAASGVASYAIYASINGGPWSPWTTVPASTPTATYTGQSNTTYSFYSIATDLAGNVEVESPRIEASTYLPDLTPPVTAVDATTGTNPSKVNSTTGTFTLDLTGSDPGGAALTYFEVFVSIDGGTYQEVGPYAIPAGFADSRGNDHSTITYQGLTDGQSHSYSFYSIGLDAGGNLQNASSSPVVAFANQVFAPAQPNQVQVSSFTVEHGSPSRSFIQYLDLGFNESDTQSDAELTAIVNSIKTAAPDIAIYKYDLNGDASSKVSVPLSSPTMLSVLDHAIEINFGSGGIGNSPTTTAPDGYYEVDIKLPSGQVAVHHFDRLLGDVAGDGIVDQNDLNEIAASINETSELGWAPLSASVTGDGTVTSLDLLLATRSKNRRLGSGLALG
jgi:hypothetical protein